MPTPSLAPTPGRAQEAPAGTGAPAQSLGRRGEPVLGWDSSSCLEVVPRTLLAEMLGLGTCTHSREERDVETRVLTGIPSTLEGLRLLEIVCGWGKGVG